jgi:acetyl esterase/lipase
MSAKVLLALAVLVAHGSAQQPSVPAPDVPAPLLLWPAGAPGATGDTDADKPAITVFLPNVPNPTKTGVVIAPGGGYTHLAIDKEGYAFAHWLNQHGVAAFVLRYRLGPQYHHPIEIGDAQRAIRLVRSHAAEYGIEKDRLGMWGSSAGGHLAATAGTQSDAGKPDASDPIDRESSKPQFLILSYPVITLMDPLAHTGSRKFLLGDNPDPALVKAMSVETRVTADTPPTFLFSTTDDKTVPVLNSVIYYEALVKAGVPAEMHIFQHGAHGAGLATANPDLNVWPDLLIKWMRERGYAAPAQ